MNPATWTPEDRRAFWIGLWANAALAVVVVVAVKVLR